MKVKIVETRRWHLTISCQPDGRPPQPVQPWKSGRVHLAEDSNVVVLTVFYRFRPGEVAAFARGRAAIERMEIKHVPGYSHMS